MKKVLLIIAFVFGIAAVNAQTNPSGWTLDKSHTSIRFSVPHLVISEVDGYFQDFNIEIQSSKEDFTDMKVKASIRVASINTDNSQRDNHLKSDDFFNAEKYPEIKFISTDVKKVSDKNYKITGDLTIRDITRKVVFDAIRIGTVKSPWGQTVSAWKASLKLNRFDYNLKWDKKIETGGLVVGDEITINMNIELTK